MGHYSSTADSAHANITAATQHTNILELINIPMCKQTTEEGYVSLQDEICLLCLLCVRVSVCPCVCVWRAH